MRIKPSRKSKVLIEVGPGESKLLSSGGARGPTRGSAVRFERILVPVDFSEDSRSALRQAIELAREFESELICLHVIEVAYGVGEMGYVMDVAAMQGDMRKQMDKNLSRLIDEAGYEPARGLVRTGVPYSEIIMAAEEEGADLIVLGSHGRSALTRFFLGSTSERVVRHAPCPVMIFREKTSAKKRRKAEAAKASGKPGRNEKTIFI